MVSGCTVGKPSLKAAEELKLKKEAQELGLNNIIASEGKMLIIVIIHSFSVLQSRLIVESSSATSSILCVHACRMIYC